MNELKFVCECGKSYPASKIKTDILNTYCDECGKKIYGEDKKDEKNE